MKRILSLLACANLAYAAGDVNPAGVWEVIDYTATDPATGTVKHPFGPNPSGTAIYTTRGHVSVFVSGRRRGGQGRAELLDSMYAYAGTFTVKGDTVTLHLTSAWQADWVGTEKVRTFKIDHDVLTVTTPAMTSPVDGKTYVSITTFRRVE